MANQKADLMLWELFSACDLDDREKMIDVLDRLKEHVVNMGDLPDMMSKMVISGFIAHTNWMDVEAHAHDLMEHSEL